MLGRKRERARTGLEMEGQKMRRLLVVTSMLLYPLGLVAAQVSVGIGLPNVSIGIEVPLYPDLVQVPGYPVYYAPGIDSNYFFYDGLYWDCDGDNWYASSWYNGPWSLVDQDSVPEFILRVPVRYYRRPPAYFSGWASDDPPRWGEHWGNGWERQHSGWDHWNRNAPPQLAPLPVYQKQYAGNRYPDAAHQESLHAQNYRYQPNDSKVQQVYRAQGLRGSQPSQSANKGAQAAGNPKQLSAQRTSQPANMTNTAKAQPAEYADKHNAQRTSQPANMTNTAKAQPVENADKHNAQRTSQPAKMTNTAKSEPVENADKHNVQRTSQPAKMTNTAKERPAGNTEQHSARPTTQNIQGGGQPTMARAKTEEPQR